MFLRLAAIITTSLVLVTALGHADAAIRLVGAGASSNSNSATRRRRRTDTTGGMDDRIRQIQELEQYLSENNRFTGTFSVSFNGEELANSQIGIAFPGASAPKPNNETLYRIGSISKTFTAVMILQLVQECKLTLDALLSDFFPNMANANEITIEHMLRHESGLSDFSIRGQCGTYDTRPQTRQDVVERIENCPAQFEPGTRTAYSNTNFLVLGFIMEDITGNSYGDELKTRITDPLSLTHTKLMTPPDEDQNVAFSFNLLGDDTWSPVYPPETHPSIPGGAGTIMSTTSDLLSFITGLFETEELISRDSREKMIQMDQHTFGMGIMGYQFGSDRGFGHGGSIDAFQSFLCYFPGEKSVAVAVIGNSHDVVGSMDVAKELFNIVSSETYTLPKQMDDRERSNPAGIFIIVVVSIATLVICCCGLIASRRILSSKTASNMEKNLNGEETATTTLDLASDEK